MPSPWGLGFWHRNMGGWKDKHWVHCKYPITFAHWECGIGHSRDCRDEDGGGRCLKAPMANMVLDGPLSLPCSLCSRHNHSPLAPCRRVCLVSLSCLPRSGSSHHSVWSQMLTSARGLSIYSGLSGHTAFEHPVNFLNLTYHNLLFCYCWFLLTNMCKQMRIFLVDCFWPQGWCRESTQYGSEKEEGSLLGEMVLLGTPWIAREFGGYYIFICNWLFHPCVAIHF